MIDSPKTPATPSSPVDISIGGKPLSLSQCEHLAKSVQHCSKSLIEGAWTDFPDVRGNRVKFIPSNFESAKAFLRNSIKVPSDSTRQRVSNSATPLSSRPQQGGHRGGKLDFLPEDRLVEDQPKIKMQRVMTCHGCHLVIGGGEHNGSAIGKDKCTLPHSDRCFGSIPESDNWRACPPNYVPYAGVGFSQTLGLGDFQTAHVSTPLGAGSSSIQMYPSEFSEVSPNATVQHLGCSVAQDSLGAAAAGPTVSAESRAAVFEQSVCYE